MARKVGEKNERAVIEAIQNRRSVRRFRKARLRPGVIEDILEAGRWAPSGLNNQPWKFLVLAGEKKDAIGVFTHYASVVKGADAVIAVFLDHNLGYNRDRDCMAIGAAIQNMLLVIHAKGLGGCWLGEIVNRKNKVSAFLHMPKNLELAAVVAVGVARTYPRRGRRRALKKCIL
ncbi:MAG: nitroreductase [Candidatus Omnitrophica bacterium]|nr:nitroreductase [Candidatus Omnitrophota bacterium]